VDRVWRVAVIEVTSTMDTRTACMLARYNAWADQVIFNAVAALPPGEAAKERPTLFKSMIGTLNHNLVVALIWRAHLEGRSHGFTARNGVLHPDLDRLWAAQQAVNAWTIAWSEQQTDWSLDETVHFTFISGTEAAMSRGEMLLHIVNHTTYHRGWVSEMFFDVPAKPPESDLSVFLCEARR
jgi:uncharacterized damage-inducible protein DinB